METVSAAAKRLITGIGQVAALSAKGGDNENIFRVPSVNTGDPSNHVVMCSLRAQQHVRAHANYKGAKPSISSKEPAMYIDSAGVETGVEPHPGTIIDSVSSRPTWLVCCWPGISEDRQQIAIDTSV